MPGASLSPKPHVGNCQCIGERRDVVDLLVDRRRVEIHLDLPGDDSHITVHPDHDPESWVGIVGLLNLVGLRIIEDDRLVEFLDDGRMRQHLSAE